MWYYKEKGTFLDEAAIEDMIHDGKLKPESILYECEKKQNITHNIIDRIGDSLYDEFGEDIELKEEHKETLKKMQVELNLILTYYKSEVPNFGKPVKASDTIK